MKRLRLRTPSRLHFGLLARDPRAGRQFGGVRLMIDAPGLELTAVPAGRRGADGPRAPPGLHGPDEARAFAQLPPIPEPITDRLCRLVLLDLLPAVVEADLERFGAALVEIQHRVGQGFAPAQGGLFAHPRLEAIA